jgi:hypothetical protein
MARRASAQIRVSASFSKWSSEDGIRVAQWRSRREAPGSRTVFCGTWRRRLAAAGHASPCWTPTRSIPRSAAPGAGRSRGPCARPAQLGQPLWWRVPERRRARGTRTSCIVDNPAPGRDRDEAGDPAPADLVLMPMQHSPADFGPASATMTAGGRGASPATCRANACPPGAPEESIRAALAEAACLVLEGTLGNRDGVATDLPRRARVTDSPRRRARPRPRCGRWPFRGSIALISRMINAG